MVKAKHDAAVLEKCPTGIKGLDEITQGGLPKGRPTLICGSAGSGKTLFAMEFLIRGALEDGEPGVFMTFEESPEDLAKNFSSLGFDLPDMTARGLIAMDQVYIERREIEETGEYDLEGLFIRLGCAIDSIGIDLAAGSKKGCSSFIPPGLHFTVWRCIWSPSTRSSMSSTPMFLSWTRSAT